MALKKALSTATQKRVWVLQWNWKKIPLLRETTVAAQIPARILKSILEKMIHFDRYPLNIPKSFNNIYSPWILKFSFLGIYLKENIIDLHKHLAPRMFNPFIKK